MNLIHRISATFSSKVDSLVSHVENHDAVVEAALKDTRNALAKARVRLTRVHKDGENLRRKLHELRHMEATWTERAKTTASDNEQKALECVGRRNLCREQASQTAITLKQHEELEANMADSVTRMEQRLTELTQQRNMMRSRHSAADAQRVINQIEGSSAHGIEDIFDRWEMLITETEYASGNLCQQTDALDAGFAKQENSEALKADLAALLAENAPTPTNHKE